MVIDALANEVEYENHQHQLSTEESHSGTSSQKEEVVYECGDAEGYDVEKFKVDGKRFSHAHPLALTISIEEEEEEEEEEGGIEICMICWLPILSSPSYTCAISNNACKFFLHQQCALKLPPKFIHPAHGPSFNAKHILQLTPATYECGDCYFRIHPLVAVCGVEIKIRHKSHPLHEMEAFCKVISCECDGCGKTHQGQGFFFSCQDCNFWIHQDCTILPNIITFQNQPYPFILAYSLPPYIISDAACRVCEREPPLRHNGVYYCPQSNMFAHVACAMEHFASKTRRLELMQLPDDEWGLEFPSCVIRRYAASTSKSKSKPLLGESEDELRVEEYHKHSHNHEASTKLACDLCTQPIPLPIENETSFYTCNEDDCGFAAHKMCADILPILKFFIPNPYFGGDDEPRNVARHYPDVSTYMFSSIFYCSYCHRPCNGICYKVEEEAYRCGMPALIDLECMAAPATVKHASHPRHTLFRTHRLSPNPPLTCCPRDPWVYDVYRCITCDYLIHISCAMLPRRIRFLEYHHHPLHLLFATGTTTCCCFCEVCEQDIDLNYWLYRCIECDQSFHVNCIPSLGYLSKVKFGGKFSLPTCHVHPLRLTRMLTLPTQRCAHCKLIIQGLVDEIAFFCSLCHFWLHFSCAALQTSPRLKLYSDFDEKQAIRELREEYD